MFYGKRWMIDGVPAGPINRCYLNNGEYTVLFEREYATLEQIEGINWAHPTIQYIWPHGTEAGLPEGYGFEVVRIEYDSGCKTYKVTLKTASQYLGDVTGYQAQITELEAAAAEKDSTITAQAAQLAEAKENLAAANAQLAELEAVYDET